MIKYVELPRHYGVLHPVHTCRPHAVVTSVDSLSGTVHFHEQNVFCCIGLKELGETAYKEYGPVFRVWLTVVPIVILLQPEHLQVGTDTSITVSSKYPCHYAANEAFCRYTGRDSCKEQ